MAEVKNTADLIEEVYLRRARQLAERQSFAAKSATFGALIVRLGTERYGIELSALAEVFPYRGCTAVPGAPPALVGVTNVRGDIRSVVDLRRLLDLPPVPTSQRSAEASEERASGYVVMLRQQDRTIGLRVDSIDEVRQIDPATLSAGDGQAPIPGSRFVKGLTADTVIVIDTGAALSGLGLANA